MGEGGFGNIPEKRIEKETFALSFDDLPLVREK